MLREESRLQLNKLKQIIQISRPGQTYLIYPNMRFGRGGQGVVCSALLADPTIKECAAKLPTTEALDAEDLINWVNGLFSLNLTLETINSVNLLPYFADYILSGKKLVPQKNTYSKIFIEGFAGYIVNHLIDSDPRFEGVEKRLVTATDMVFLKERLANDRIVLYPVVITPEVKGPVEHLSQTIERIRNSRDVSWSIEELATVIEELGEVFQQLQVAHNNGIIHRDLKLDNFLRTEKGMKLTDFGISLVQGYSLPSLMTVGTLSSGAPDGNLKEGWTPKSDQFNIFASITTLILLAAGNEKAVFLKRHVEKWDWYKTFDYAKSGKSEVIHDFYRILRETFSFASKESIDSLYALLTQGMAAKPSQRHEDAVVAIAEVACILREIACEWRVLQGEEV